MKSIDIIPQNIIISEPAIEEEYLEKNPKRFCEYIHKFNNREVINKKVIITKNKDGEYIALDGNKLCLVARFMGCKTVPCILLDSEDDFEKFILIENIKTYNSALIHNKIDRNNVISYRKECCCNFFKNDIKIDKYRKNLETSCKIKLNLFMKDNLLYSKHQKNQGLK